MTNLVIFLIIAYVTVLVLMYSLQRMMLYHPSKRIEAPEAYGLEGFSEYFINAADGTRLQIWYRPAQAGFPTIAYFHGNADHMGGRAPLFSALTAKGFGLAALSYRGYGKSEGTPSEQGLYQDARAMIGFVESQGVAPNRIMLYGESLGTGIATQMAVEYPVAALALQSPYISVEDRASELYRFIPVKWLMKDKYRSIDKIGKIKATLILFHGEMDSIIPVSHGRRMLEAAPEPKKAYFLPQTSHNDFDSTLISEHVLDFARQHQLVKP
jgi:fermentation-respiration switch protein FrsA (DUF1100 family)